jgi:hypothetical protein
MFKEGCPICGDQAGAGIHGWEHCTRVIRAELEKLKAERDELERKIGLEYPVLANELRLQLATVIKERDEWKALYENSNMLSVEHLTQCQSDITAAREEAKAWKDLAMNAEPFVPRDSLGQAWREALAPFPERGE